MKATNYRTGKTGIFGKALMALSISCFLVLTNSAVGKKPGRPKISPQTNTQSLPELSNAYSASTVLTSETGYFLPGMRYSLERTLAGSHSVYVKEFLDWPADITQEEFFSELEFLEGQLVLKVSLVDVQQVSAQGIGLSNLLSEFYNSNIAQNVADIRVRHEKIKVLVRTEFLDATTGRALSTGEGIAMAQGKSMAAYLDSFKGTNQNTVNDTTNFNREVYVESVLGQAFEKALHSSLKQSITKLKAHPWECLVADVREDRVYLNVGDKSHLKPGDELVVRRMTEIIKDPKSGRILKVLSVPIGRIKVVTVLDEIVICETVANAYEIQPLDILRLGH